MTVSGQDLALTIRAILDRKKAGDVLVLDVRGLSGVTDYLLIASATSTPHLRAMANEVLSEMKHAGVAAFGRSGDPESGWMALDYVDVVIHVLRAELRRYYDLEGLWARAPRIPPTTPAP